MKTSYASAIVLALSALASGYATAGGHGGDYQFPETGSATTATTSKTRSDVIAELVEARRTGDIVVSIGNSSKKLNELYPEQYPAKSVVQGKTREQVLVELSEARSKGEIVANVGGGHFAN